MASVNITWFDAANLFTFGVVLTLSIYHLFIYLGRRAYHSERANLYFSIFSIFFFLLLLLNTYGPMLPDFPDVQRWIFSPFLEWLIALVISYAGGLFLLISYGVEESLKAVFKGFIPSLVFFALSGATTVFRFFVPFQFYSDNFYAPAVIFVTLGILLMLARVIVLLFQRGISWGKNTLLITTALILMVVENLTARILWVLGIYEFGNSYLLSALAMFLFSFSLARKFNQEYRELSRLKNALNQEVRNKTAELRQAMESLKKNDEEKTRFYLRAAHETKTPLTLIKNYFDRYIRERDDSRELKMIQGNLDSLIHDMNELMDMEKFQGNLPLFDNHQSCDLRAYLLEWEILLEEMARGKGIPLAITADTPCWIQADPWAVRRIVHNLFDNSLKFSEPGEALEISLHSREEQVILSFQDHGEGIPPEAQEEVFRLFAQAPSGEKHRGIGMGLYVVKEIADSLSAEIQLTSTPGEGSHFQIIFPGISPPEEPGENPVHSDPLKGKVDWSALDAKVLIVEDNHGLRDLMLQAFSPFCEVRQASHGLQALEILEEDSFDLIISDIMMPRMDGLELLGRLLENQEHKSIPFLFLTARNSSQERIEQLSRGAVDYINKPFSMEEVLAKAGALIRFSKEKQEAVMDQTVNAIKSLVRQRDKGKEEPLSLESLLQRENVTERQQEIILLIAQGLEYKEIAHKLNLSPKTINRHMQILYKKYQVNNKIELLNYFQSHGTETPS